MTCAETLDPINKDDEEGVRDSAVTSHFSMIKDKYKSFNQLMDRFPITLPDGRVIYATNICKLYMPNLPSQGRIAYVVLISF